MLIDWFTVLAQIVNFLVLVALLKHFFFGRLIEAIDSREQRIAARLAQAEEKKREADLAAERLQSEIQEESRKRATLLAEAQRDADETRARMVREARASVQALERKWMDELEREKSVYLGEVRRRSAAQILAVIRRALADLACTDLETCAARVFINKLRDLDAASLRDISAGGEVKVLMAMDLSADERREIRDAIAARLGSEPLLEFVRAPELAWGIELRAGGRRIGWSSDSYLESLEQNLREALDQQAENIPQAVS